MIDNTSCNDQCPTYPICQHRNSVQRYEICPAFRKCVVSTIEDHQKKTDEEKGKGKLTVVGIRINGRGVMIDKSGNKISD